MGVGWFRKSHQCILPMSTGCSGEKKKTTTALFRVVALFLLSVLCGASCVVICTCYSVCLSPEEYAQTTVSLFNIC